MSEDTDPEIGAMQVINKALSTLEDEEAAKRVLRWANEKFGGGEVQVRVGHQIPRPDYNNGGDGGGQDAGDEAGARFSEFAELVDSANPKTDVERTLVSGYWAQVCKGEANFVAQDVNNRLKNIGYPVKNITDAFNGLINRKPAYILQLQKSGTSRQARKRYKVTEAGIKRVEAMIVATSSSEGA